jgi:hypothetical protein
MPLGRVHPAVHNQVTGPTFVPGLRTACPTLILVETLEPRITGAMRTKTSNQILTTTIGCRKLIPLIQVVSP